MTMPKQLPQITILPVRHPDPREAIFQHPSQNQLRILAIRLLLAHPLRADLGRVPDPQLKLQLPEQSFKPASLPTGFHPDTHAQQPGGEITIKLLRFLSVLQAPFFKLPSVGIDQRNLLKPRVVICSYNDHCSAPFSRALVGWHHQSLLGRGSRHCYGINCTNDDVKIPAGSFPAVAVGRPPPQQSSAQSGAWWSSHIHRRFHKGGIPDSPDHEYRCGAMTTYAGRTIERFA